MARAAKELMAEEDPAEIERAWIAEVFRRATEIDEGAVSTRPAVEVFRAAQEELHAIRASRTR